MCFIWKLTQLAAQLLFTLSVFKLSCFFCNINIYYPKYWSEIYFSTCFYSNISKLKTYFFPDDNDLVSNYFSRREKKRGLLSIFQGIKESVLPSRSKKAYWLFNENNNNNSSNKRAIKSVFSTNEWFVQRPKKHLVWCRRVLNEMIKCEILIRNSMKV